MNHGDITSFPYEGLNRISELRLLSQYDIMDFAFDPNWLKLTK